jgi:hypothetical protein
MGARLNRALRVGFQAWMAAMLLQATAAAALATALPEVGHVHPEGTPNHAHSLVQVGGLATLAPRAPALAPPQWQPRARWRPARLQAPHTRARVARWDRAPPLGATVNAEHANPSFLLR